MNPMNRCTNQGGCFVMSRTVRSQALAIQSMQGPHRGLVLYQHYNTKNQSLNMLDPYVDDFAFQQQELLQPQMPPQLHHWAPPMSMGYPSSGLPAETFTPTAYQTHQTTGSMVPSPTPALYQLQIQQMLLDQQEKSLKKKEKKMLKRELKQKAEKHQAYSKQSEQHNIQVYESVKPQQVLPSAQHHMYQTVAPQDSFVECETSSEVTDTESTEESPEEITKYDAPMEMVKQQKSTVPESKRVKYVETPQTKMIQHVSSLVYEMEVVTSNRHFYNQKRCLEQWQIMGI